MINQWIRKTVKLKSIYVNIEQRRYQNTVAESLLAPLPLIACPNVIESVFTKSIFISHTLKYVIAFNIILLIGCNTCKVKTNIY